MKASESPSSGEEAKSSQPLPNSAKVYRSGKVYPNVRVPFRQITLSPTKSFRGATEPNEPICVYDCSGPWGDAAFEGDVEQGLPALRRPWILERGDVEEVDISYKARAGTRDHGSNGKGNGSV